jgi:hypothetical protein
MCVITPSHGPRSSPDSPQNLFLVSFKHSAILSLFLTCFNVFIVFADFGQRNSSIFPTVQVKLIQQVLKPLVWTDFGQTYRDVYNGKNGIPLFILFLK